MITQKRLKEVLDYNPKTGMFAWKIPTGRRKKIGVSAGYLCQSGYIEIGVDKKRYKAHRLAWFYMYGEFPKGEIDHINNCRSDNRICNLKLSTRSKNLKNHSGLYKTNTSGVTGVSHCKNNGNWTWKAFIASEGKQIHLGYFDNMKDAVVARKEAEKKYGFTINK